MFCNKCGKEIPEDALFCPECGSARYGAAPPPELYRETVRAIPGKTAAKRKKRKGAVCAAAAILALAAAAAFLFLRKNPLEEYIKFYREYYEANTGGRADAQQADCAGRIVMGPDGRWYLSIVDTVPSREGDWSEDLYLYAFKKGKVVQEAALENISMYDNTGMFLVRDGSLYFGYSDYSTGNRLLYRLDEGGGFAPLDRKGMMEAEEWFPYYTYDYGGSGEYAPGMSARVEYRLANAIGLESGREFEETVDSLRKEKVKTPLELQLFYGGRMVEGHLREWYMEENGSFELSESPVVAVAETEDAYYGVGTDRNAILLRMKDRETADVPSALKDVKGCQVTRIGEGAFHDCRNLEDAAIPGTVTSIGGSAFRGCGSLKTVAIPDSVTEIGDYAFSECGALEQAAIPEGVQSVGVGAFMGCGKLVTVTLSSTVTNIGSYLFADCKALKAVTIPDSVTAIGGYAFSGCSALEAIEIPGSVAEIGENAFYGCEKLAAVTLPPGVVSLGENAFGGCRSLKTLVIPESVTSLGSQAFAGCNALEKIEVPDSVTEIGEDILEGTSDVVIFCGDDTQMGSYADRNSIAHINGTIGSVSEEELAGLKEKMKWKDAYIRYFSSDEIWDDTGEYDDDHTDQWYVALRDVNDNGIPEIFLLADESCVIFYSVDHLGGVQKKSYWFSSFAIRYIGKEGLVAIGCGFTDYGYESILSVDKEGRISEIHSGGWSGLFWNEATEDYEYESCFWDNKDMSDQEYHAALTEAFDEEKSEYVELNECDGGLSDIVELIQNY